MSRRRSDHANSWKGLAAGTLGGIAGAWTMNAFQSLLSEIQKRRAESQSSTGQRGSNQQKHSSTTDDPATVKAAQAVSKQIFHHELREDEKSWAGNTAHYVMGAGSGAIYGGVAEVIPAATLGRGLLFGSALWAVADETIVPALGLSKSPFQYPASMHGYALVSHLLYGITVDAARRLAVRLL